MTDANDGEGFILISEITRVLCVHKETDPIETWLIRIILRGEIAIDDLIFMGGAPGEAEVLAMKRYDHILGKVEEYLLDQKQTTQIVREKPEPYRNRAGK